MRVQTLGFYPPFTGMDKGFNTFRLGTGMLKKVQEGDEVFLLDEKQKVVFGRARVTRLTPGKLADLCVSHAGMNHTEVDKVDKENSGDRLKAYILKLYGPHIAHDEKRTVVVELERIE